MAVILVNLLLKQFESTVASDSNLSSTGMKQFCGKYQKIVTTSGYSIPCTTCRSWFHRACSPFGVQEIKRMSKSEWHCGCPVSPDQSETVIFASYVDDIIRSARKDDMPDILKKVNSFHPKLHFTIQYPDNDSIPFLDMNVRRDDGKLSTGWYQKPTDIGILLSFRYTIRKRHHRRYTSRHIQRDVS